MLLANVFSARKQKKKRGQAEELLQGKRYGTMPRGCPQK